MYNNEVASKKPHQKIICKISASSASNKVKGGESSMQPGSFDQIYQDYFEPVYRYVQFERETGQ